MHSTRVSCRLALTTFLALTPGAASAQTYRDPTAAAIGFGGAAAIAGEQIVIGRPGTLIGFPIPPSHAGTVHIFVRSGDRWMEQGMVRAKDGVLGDGFGTAIATDGNLMAVGAPGATGGGAVYVFERGSGGRWVERWHREDGVSRRCDAGAARQRRRVQARRHDPQVRGRG